MNFDLTPEQQQVSTTAAGIAARYFDPHTSPGPDNHREFVRERATRLAALGLTGIAFPTEDGGQGGSLLDSMLVLREVARVCPRTADVVQAYNFGGIRQLQAAGSDELKAEFLAPALTGSTLISLAMSEADAGSALSRMRTVARFDRGDVVVDGTKLWATHGVDADTLIVWCRFTDTNAANHGEVGAVVVPDDAPGFSRGATEHFMSGERYCEMVFDGCRVPARNVLVDRDGFRRLFPVFNIERLGNATRSLALAAAAFEHAKDYVQQRSVDRGLLRDQQGIQWKIADMRMRLDAAELLLMRAASAEGGPSDQQTAIAKCYANETGCFVADESLQILGAVGYSTQSPVEYIFRRTRGWRIAGGTSEVLRNRIARNELGPRPAPARPTHQGNHDERR